MTRDERLLLEIYRRIQKSGKKSAAIDYLALGKSLGYKEHLVKNILRGLMQANLVKSVGQGEIGLTPRGIEVAESLIQ